MTKAVTDNLKEDYIFIIAIKIKKIKKKVNTFKNKYLLIPKQIKFYNIKNQ